MTSPHLHVSHLTVRYGAGCQYCRDSPEPSEPLCSYCGSLTGCRDITFTADHGEVVGIVGESGSGKSTLLRALALATRPTTGTVSLRGHRVSDLTGRARRRTRITDIGVVEQASSDILHPGVSALGNVAEPLLARGWRHFEQIRAEATARLEETEIPSDRMSEPVRTYSGGMRQRVQLARAFAGSPQLILLDEPTNGLDVSVQARVLDLIRRLAGDKGTTMLIVSHDLATVRILAQRTLVMSAGRVVEAGMTDQILQDPQHPYTQLLVSSQL
ncbi:ATP-binding cassette domain-containing protein [Streptomyces sp. NPDC001508]|uniref:ATP-binding cassette domain-containing protein n=1 Tax=Streptomyces sp. NPDC001508 TaxID=3154656 RepID=UPI0033250AA8